MQATLAQNGHRHLVKAHAKNPSLLARFLVDAEGERLVATHANKQGRRYRYYVSASLLRARCGDQAEDGRPAPAVAWRLPAAEIEGLVLQILAGALGDREWLMAQAPQAGLIAEQQAVMQQAHRLWEILRGEDTLAKRGLLLTLLDLVVLADGWVELRLKSSALRPELAADDGRVADGPASLIRIKRPVALRRRGLETRLVIEGESAPEPQPDPALIKALAQAHRWWRDLLDQRFDTVRELAQAYGTDERYVARVVPLAYLSPSLTAAILDGRQPPGMTLRAFLLSAP